MVDSCGSDRPWLPAVGPRDLDRREAKRQWTRERLRQLRNPDEQIVAWERIEGLELHTNRNAYGLNGEQILRELSPKYRFTIRGQLALEGGFVKEGGGIAGSEVEDRRQKEDRIYAELLACVVCRQEKDLRNRWICEACYKDWQRKGRPRGQEYDNFAKERRTRPMSQGYMAPDLHICVAVRYTVKAAKVLETFQHCAENLPWRDRIAEFRLFLDECHDK